MPKNFYELGSLFPYAMGSVAFVGEGREVVNKKDNQEEWIGLPNWFHDGKPVVSVFVSDYLTDKANHVTYALRLKKESKKGLDNMLATAYRYEWVGDFNSITIAQDIVPSYFKVTTRYLGPNWDGSVDDLAGEDFWENNTQSDVTRIIYALGSLDDLYKERTDTNAYERRLGTRADILTPKFYDDSMHADGAILNKSSWSANRRIPANRNKDIYKGKNVIFPIWLFSNE